MENEEFARLLRKAKANWCGTNWRVWIPGFNCIWLSGCACRNELEDAARQIANMIDPNNADFYAIARDHTTSGVTDRKGARNSSR